MGQTPETPNAGEMTPGANRRAGVRIPTRTSIALLRRDPAGQVLHTSGSIRDISPSGAYFYADQCLPQGTGVEFDLVFPSEMTAAEPMRLHGNGEIVRTEPVEKRFGSAMTINSHTLTPIRRDDLTCAEAERRAQARIQPPAPLFAEYPGLESVISDISPTGAFIQDERPLPVGRVFTVRVHGSPLSSALEVRAIVRRVEPQVGMAVEFLSMSEEALKALRALTGEA